jgi:fumarate reductase flavoprotein subunit
MSASSNRKGDLAHADLVVVGGGGSGLAAAVTAAEAGATVILLEKNASLGGTTALSVGSFTAGGTSLQREAGITDSQETFRSDLVVANAELEERENHALRDVFILHAAESFEWLRSLGLQFFGPTEEPPFTRPRMHNIVPNSRAYIAALHRAARRAGVSIRTSFLAKRLLRDSSGRIVGVEGPSRIHARLGVVLATGDYSANEGLKEQWISAQTARLPAVNPSSTGDGFLMALEVGALVKNADRAVEDLRLLPSQRASIDPISWLPPSPFVARTLRVAIERLPRSIISRFVRAALTAHVAPSQALFRAGAILVNQAGHRFANEEDAPARALASMTENMCYVVFDARVARLFSSWPNPLSTFPGVAYAYLSDYKRFRPDVTHHAATVPELAAAIGADPQVLQETIDCYTEYVARGTDDDFHRESLGEGIVEPPFYALGPLSAFVTITDGGLTVDGECRVLDAEDTPIAGLYAVGSTGQSGLILRNHGLHIAWAITSGRLAARAAVRGADSADAPP